MSFSFFYSSLITIENGEEPVKKSNGVVEGVSFDQILDLDSLPDSNKAETDGLVGLPTPIIAFEESITQQNNTAGNDQQILDPSYPTEILCRGEPSKEHKMVTEAHRVQRSHLILTHWVTSKIRKNFEAG